MERPFRQCEIRLGWKPNLFLQSFTGVLEALAVLICCFVHYVVIRVLRRSGLRTPCSCPPRFRKHLMPTLDHSVGLEENCSVDHLESFPKKVALEGFAGLSTAVGGVETRIAMAESRFESGGDDGQSGYSTPAENLTDREQRDTDNDQDVMDKELFEALQSERETLAALYSELEQERSCSATAASEALAMISRLQEEKAAVQLEARQFQRMVLEKAMYDQEAIEALNELLVSREEEKIALEEEIRVCREKLDSAMREEKRQSLIPEAKGDDGRVSLHSPTLTESPILMEREKIITTPGFGSDEQSTCVDKFSTTKCQVLTALVQDGELGLGPKFGKSEERDDEKPEFPGFASLRRRWRSQEVSFKTLERTKEERQIEERRIEERRLSVLEYVMKFEQQQQGLRLPVKMQSVTRHPKSAEEPRFKTRSVDIDESTSSITSRKDEPTSRVLTGDDSLRRRLFGDEDCDEFQKSNASSSEEGVEDGGRCEEPPSGTSVNGDKLMTSEVCTGTNNADECVKKALFVHDVYEVQKSPYEVPAPVMEDAEMQPATPSDRLGKPDLQTFERDEDGDFLCLIHPSNLHDEVEDSGNDLQWEDLQGKVRYKTLRVSKSLRIRDNSRSEVEEEVQDLTQRLQALEADKYFMKQTIESLRRENGEMKLLQDLAQQFRELEGVEQQELWPRRMPMTLQFQGLMSFTRLRNNAQARLNKLAQTCLKGTETTEPQGEQSVGLSRLLQQSPERLRGTRLTRSSSWIAERIIPSTALSRKKERWPF